MLIVVIDLSSHLCANPVVELQTVGYDGQVLVSIHPNDRHGGRVDPRHRHDVVIPAFKNTHVII